MSEARLDGLKRVIAQFHAGHGQPRYARGLMTATDRLDEFDAAYAALEEDGDLQRAGGLTEFVLDEFGQRHRRPRFVSARSGDGAK